MRTWGLDLSTAPANVGLVRVDWLPGQTGSAACFTTPDCSRTAISARIASTVSDGDWWAVDVPFGWPAPFVDFLAEHRHGPAKLPKTDAATVPWAALARRTTDREVVGKYHDHDWAVSGFSVSFDKLGATAAAWAWIEEDLRSQHQIEIDRSGVHGKVVETYPAAAWKAWGGPGTPASLSWSEMEPQLRRVVTPADERSADQLSRSAHHRDALVCALVAKARADGRTILPNTNLDLIAQEGWIHLPDHVSLDELPT